MSTLGRTPLFASTFILYLVHICTGAMLEISIINGSMCAIHTSNVQDMFRRTLIRAVSELIGTETVRLRKKARLKVYAVVKRARMELDDPFEHCSVFYQLIEVMCILNREIATKRECTTTQTIHKKPLNMKSANAHSAKYTTHGYFQLYMYQKRKRLLLSANRYSTTASEILLLSC